MMYILFIICAALWGITIGAMIGTRFEYPWLQIPMWVFCILMNVFNVLRISGY